MNALGALQTILAEAVSNARVGLPKDVFYLVSALTPMINVDLLIRDQEGKTLLTWRDDNFYGPGWHIPGGIIRFKEHWRHRIDEVALQELGASVVADVVPAWISEIMNQQRDVRGHFISLLFRCRLANAPDPARGCNVNAPINGGWSWFKTLPSNLIAQHEFYRNVIDEL